MKRGPRLKTPADAFVNPGKVRSFIMGGGIVLHKDFRLTLDGADVTLAYAHHVICECVRMFGCGLLNLKMHIVQLDLLADDPSTEKTTAGCVILYNPKGHKVQVAIEGASPEQVRDWVMYFLTPAPAPHKTAALPPPLLGGAPHR